MKTRTKEIHFLRNSTQIVMLTISKYNNRVAIFDLQSKKKLIDKRVRASIIQFYKSSGQFYEIKPKIAKTKMKKNGLGDYLPKVQYKLFQQDQLF